MTRNSAARRIRSFPLEDPPTMPWRCGPAFSIPREDRRETPGLRYWTFGGIPSSAFIAQANSVPYGTDFTPALGTKARPWPLAVSQGGMRQPSSPLAHDCGAQIFAAYKCSSIYMRIRCRPARASIHDAVHPTLTSRARSHRPAIDVGILTSELPML